MSIFELGKGIISSFKKFDEIRNWDPQCTRTSFESTGTGRNIGRTCFIFNRCRNIGAVIILNEKNLMASISSRQSVK